MDRLSRPVYNTNPTNNGLLSRQIYISIAKSIAIILHTFGDVNKSKKLILQLENLIYSKKLGEEDTSDSVQLFAILTLGEIGRIYSQTYEVVKTKTP